VPGTHPAVATVASDPNLPPFPTSRATVWRWAAQLISPKLARHGSLSSPGLYRSPVSTPEKANRSGPGPRRQTVPLPGTHDPHVRLGGAVDSKGQAEAPAPPPQAVPFAESIRLYTELMRQIPGGGQSFARRHNWAAGRAPRPVPIRQPDVTPAVRLAAPHRRQRRRPHPPAGLPGVPVSGCPNGSPSGGRGGGVTTGSRIALVANHTTSHHTSAWGP